MKNVDKWTAKRFTRNRKGRIQGTYMHKILGNAYEPAIRSHTRGLLADVGCGDVPYYLWYRDLISDNTCIDWAHSSQGTSYLDHEADLNQGLPFLETNQFDTVLCTDVLEHIHNPDHLFTEMCRILKPGGHLILTVPFLYWIHEDPHDYHRYTHYRLRNFCESNRMEVIQLEAYGGLPEILFDLVSKGYWYHRLPANKLFQRLWLSLGMFLSRRSAVKRLSARSKTSFPMGFVLVARKKS